MLHYFGFAEDVIQPWIEHTWKEIESEIIDYDLHLWHWIAFSQEALHLWSWESNSPMQHFSLVDARIKDWRCILLNPNQINQFLVQLSNGTIQCYLYTQNGSSMCISLQFSTSQVCFNKQFGYDLLQSNIFYAVDISQKNIVQFSISSTNSYTCTVQFETTSSFEFITNLYIGFHNWICKIQHKKWNINKWFGWGNNFFHSIPVEIEDNFLSFPQPLLFEKFDIEIEHACISNCWGVYLTTTGQIYWSSNNTVFKENIKEDEHTFIYLLEQVVGKNQSAVDMSDVVVDQVIGNARHVLLKTTNGQLIAMGNTSLLSHSFLQPFTLLSERANQLCKATHWGSLISLT